MKVLGNNFNVTDGLLRKLYELYPDKLPHTQITPEELAFLRGQQSVIQKLVEIQDRDFEDY